MSVGSRVLSLHCVTSHAHPPGVPSLQVNGSLSTAISGGEGIPPSLRPPQGLHSPCAWHALVRPAIQALTVSRKALHWRPKGAGQARPLARLSTPPMGNTHGSCLWATLVPNIRCLPEYTKTGTPDFQQAEPDQARTGGQFLLCMDPRRHIALLTVPGSGAV